MFKKSKGPMMMPPDMMPPMGGPPPRMGGSNDFLEGVKNDLAAGAGIVMIIFLMKYIFLPQGIAMYTYVGQKVQCIKPWSSKNLNYGMTGKVKKIDESGNIVVYWDQLRTELVHPYSHPGTWFIQTIQRKRIKMYVTYLDTFKNNTLIATPNGVITYSNYILNEFDKRSMDNKTMEVINVIFDDPVTIVYFADGDKVVVKVSENDTFVPEFGFMAAMMKRYFGKRSAYMKYVENAYVRNSKQEKETKKLNKANKNNETK